MGPQNVIRTAAFLIAVGLSGHLAAEPLPSGTVLAVVQSANIDGATGQKVLQPEAPVYSGDRVNTGPVGSAQIKFRDDTKLVVGPNSSMVIDAFVFNADNSARQISIDAVKGAFRFITGNSRKDAYTITTPTATIGVRGTEFDIAIEQEGTTRIANLEGTTKICHRDANGGPPTNCEVVSTPCSVSVIRPTQPKIARYGDEDVEFRNRQLKYYFPYVSNQAGLLPEFQANVAQCHLVDELIPHSSVSPPGPPIQPPPTVPIPVPPPPSVAPPIVPIPPPPNLGNLHDDRPVYDHR